MKELDRLLMQKENVIYLMDEAYKSKIRFLESRLNEKDLEKYKKMQKHYYSYVTSYYEVLELMSKGELV